VNEEDKSRAQLIRELAEIRESERSATSTRRAIEHALRLTQFCVDRASVGVFRVGRDARILSVNEEACRGLGYTQEELLALTVFDINPTLSRETWGDLWQAMREMGSNTIQTIHRDKQGRDFPVGVSANFLEFEGEEYAVSFVRDVGEESRIAEEREALIEELGEKNAELERFAYTVSHDLKSPLITISGFLRLVELDAQKGDAAGVSAHIRRIASAVETMTGLLDDVLRLSRVGRVANPPEDVDLGDLLENVKGVMSPAAAEAGVTFDVMSGWPTVRGDPARLFEVFQNLIENAIRFRGNARPAKVDVGFRHDGLQLVFFVRDNGIGIESRYHAKIFGLFDQLEPGSGGSGVGLSLAKRIIDFHGGRLWVESAGPGRGSTFCFTLA
jgi:PAS domain S-box-containing protein